MSQKFKQINNVDQVKLIRQPKSEIVAKNAISSLLGQVADRVYNKKAFQKSKVYVKDKMIEAQQDTVQQVYQCHPLSPKQIQQEEFPIRNTFEHHRPLSASIKARQSSSSILVSSIKCLSSHKSIKSSMSTKMSKFQSLYESGQKEKTRKTNYRKISQNKNRFIPVQTITQNDQNQQFIQKIRQKKIQQDKFVKRKQQFLKSIKIDSNIYIANQNKFLQIYARKSFIYGDNAQIIQINPKSNKNTFTKISTISKSRVQLVKKDNQTLLYKKGNAKQNILVSFNGRQQESKMKKLAFRSSQTVDLNKIGTMIEGIKPTDQKQTKKQIQKKLIKAQKKQLKIPSIANIQNTKKEIQIQEKHSKKPAQKILFYTSPHSNYQVIEESWN